MMTANRDESVRLTRERKTVTAMIQIFCRGHHGSRKQLCDACAQLHAYAMCRLDRCPYGAEKPNCADCPIHCYRAEQRAAIREVMRYAGPRMVWRHPLLAVWHLLAGRRSVPERPGRKQPAEKDTDNV
jgi:hypothetical protein